MASIIGFGGPRDNVGDITTIVINPGYPIIFNTSAGFTVSISAYGSSTPEVVATFENGLIANANEYSPGVPSSTTIRLFWPRITYGVKQLRINDASSENFPITFEVGIRQSSNLGGLIGTYEGKAGDIITLRVSNGIVYYNPSGFTVSFFPYGSTVAEAVATFGNGLITNASSFSPGPNFGGGTLSTAPRVMIPPLSVGTKQIRLNDSSSSNLATLTIYKGFDLKPTSLGLDGDATSTVTLELQNETGLGFNEPGLVISIGGEATTITSRSATTATVVVGMTGQSPGLKTIELSATKRTTTTYTDAFNYTGSARIISITPSVGVNGVPNNVEITGVNFVAPATVTFQGTSASSIVVVSPTKITCTLAPESRSGYVYVTTPNGPTLLARQAIAFTLPPIFASGANPPVINVSTVSINATTSSNNESSVGSSIDTYDASGVGLGFTKNHYHQVYKGTDQIHEALITQHGTGQLISRVSAVGFKGSVRVDSVVSINSALRSHFATRVYIHDGTHVTGFQQLHTPVNPDGTAVSDETSLVALRFGFDDTNVYSVITVEELSLGGVNEFTATNSAFLFPIAPASLPPIDAPNFAIVGAMGASLGNDAYARMRSNLIAMKDLVEAEHNATTGNHEVPLSRFDGYSLAYDGVVVAPTNVGAWTWVKIASSGYSTKRFLQPALVGAAGSGIVVPTLCYATSGVYVRLLRITSGITNDFTMKCVSISDT